MTHSLKAAHPPLIRRPLVRISRGAVVFALGLALAGCGGMSEYRGFENPHQPVVQRNQYTLDLASANGGLANGERERLAGWFDAMSLRYGDRIAIEDPLTSGSTRAAVEAAASRYGLLVGHDAPVTEGYVNAGTVRVVVIRTTATVPHCPDWSSNNETNFKNAVNSNWGCAVGSNMAAMIANPEDLLRGAHGSGLSNVSTSDKAINAYQSQSPTGQQGLKSISSKGG